MFKIHLPGPVYEHLPRLYLITAMALAVLPLSPLKWVAVVSLVLASAVTRHRRRRYRSARRLEAMRRRVASRYGKVASAGG